MTGRTKDTTKRFLPAYFIAMLLVVFLCSCRKQDENPRKPGGVAPAAPAVPAQEQKPPIGNAPLAGGSYSILAPEVLGQEAAKPEIKELRKRGLLKIAMPCGRAGLCMRMKYGVAVGFEVELVRKIANEVLGVKENIVAADAADADVRAAVRCGAPGAGPREPVTPLGNLYAGPYFYSSRGGWLCFEVLKGGAPLAHALDRIIEHFYGMGTLQQLYKNWFPIEESGVTGVE